MGVGRFQMFEEEKCDTCPAIKCVIVPPSGHLPKCPLVAFICDSSCVCLWSVEISFSFVILPAMLATTENVVEIGAYIHWN